MNQEIIYGGHSAQPADMACSDGDLSVSMGAIFEDGALKPVLRPKEERHFNNTSQLLYVHETTSYRHFILSGIQLPTAKGTPLVYSGDDIEGTISLRYFDSTINGITHLGNTLMVLADDGVHYFLWKGGEDGYKYLGTKMPELNLSFGLQGEIVESAKSTMILKGLKVAASDFISESGEIADNETIRNAFEKNNVNVLYYEKDDMYLILADESANAAKTQLLGQANKLIAEYVHNKGMFCFPFFVRYAYRLYDQSLTMHSAPILMLASNPDVSAVWRETISTSALGVTSPTETYRLKACASRLNWTLLNDVKDSISEWSDIIKSVDIFVSAPIYNYDQEGGYLFNTELPYGRQYMVGLLEGGEKYQKNYLTEDNTAFDLSRPKSKIMNDIVGCSTFYLLKSFSVSEIPTERTVIDIEKDFLSALQTKEVMTDDYISHDVLSAELAYTYNNRLSLGNIKRRLFDGFNIASALQYSNTSDTYRSMYINIKKEGRTIKVDSGGGFIYLNDLIYIFYPDSDALSADLYLGGAGSPGYRLPLHKHEFLNGAYYFGRPDAGTSLKAGSTPIASSAEERTITLPNRIFTSLVDNPFIFPAANVTSVGAGEVLALSVAKQAMSPSQFGQFPMYAFTSEGVWAMSINSEGALNPAQPITSDVCINPQGIVALDSSVMFATARGIMLLSGSQTQCISDGINGDDLFSVADLPKGDALYGIYEKTSGENERMKEKNLLPFLDFIKDSVMLYDYVHQHVFVFHYGTSYVYVYSLKSGAWGMLAVPNFRNFVGSSGTGAYCTLPYIKREDNIRYNGVSLYDFSQSDGEDVTALLVTRPFKLGAPFDFKTVNTVIQRGTAEKDKVKQVLYGTNDYRHWFVVRSSADIFLRGFRGTPYKAYRLAVIATLGKEDSLYGASVQYEMRFMNQPR